MIKVTQYAFTGYPVTDIPRARGFYEGIFGLKSSAAWEHDGKHWIEYDLGDSTFAIANISPDWKPSSDGPSIGFEVADFDEAVNTLRERGVKFVVGPIDSGVCRMVVINDPDGNSLTVHQRYTKS